jgi:uncharacterized protein involved in high-affinity Fe2+ transport
MAGKEEDGGGTGSGDVELRKGVKPSDEVTSEGIDLALEQGRAAGRAAKHMMEEVADDGGQKAAGDYIVGYAIEKAEGMYMPENGELVWQDPDEENLHVEIVVRDRDDGRLVPGLDVEATLVTEAGEEVGTHEQPYLWHPSICHYGRNWKVPGSGRYTLRVRIAPASFPRHDEKNGKRYAEEVRVEFEGVDVETGQG